MDGGAGMPIGGGGMAIGAPGGGGIIGLHRKRTAAARRGGGGVSGSGRAAASGTPDGVLEPRTHGGVGAAPGAFGIAGFGIGISLLVARTSSAEWEERRTGPSSTSPPEEIDPEPRA